MSSAIVGFEFTGDPLLAGEFLPLRQGLSVLYGLNGAGKTRLLRGIRAALLGIRDDIGIGLVVHAGRPDDLPDHVWWAGDPGVPRPFFIALAQALTDDHFTRKPNKERDLSLPEADSATEAYIRDASGEENARLTEELLRSRLFLLVPTGTSKNPAWDAWAVADLTLPAAADARSRVEALYEEDGEDEALGDWQERLGAHALFADEEATFSARRWKVGVRPERYAPYSVDHVTGDSLPGIELTGPIDFGADIIDVEQDAQRATDRFMAAVVESLDRRGAADSGQTAFIEQIVAEAAATLSERAGTLLDRILPDPPLPTLVVTPSERRFTRPALEWRFQRAGRPAVFTLDALSRAERQWATRAINKAIHDQRAEQNSPADAERPVILTIDEPEAALHRSAEARMAAAIVALAEDPRHTILIASHSPELLDTPLAQLFEVQRDGHPSGSLVQALDLSDRKALDDLGLTPSDLLRWTRVFLLVEGEHDEVILDALLGARLRAAHVQMLPLHGGTKLPHTADSQVLFEFTRAHLVGLVDNQRAETLSSTWAKAQDAAARGERDAAVDIVVSGIGKATEEANFIRTWLTASLRAEREARITPYGLERADIIEYLPVERFVPGTVDWTSARHQHEAERRDQPGKTPKDFKKWLAERFRADFSPANLRAAATGVPVPREFERLMKTLEGLSARQYFT